MSDYRTLEAWRVAHQLVLAVYEVTTSYPPVERFGLMTQTRRAAASIPANVAEGSGRDSDRDFARFIAIATGSANETEYHLLLASDLGYLSGDDLRRLLEHTVRVRSMLTRLRQSLTTSRREA